MTIANWCILGAIFLPWICTILYKVLGNFKIKDNKDPRKFSETVTGSAKRALNAEKNSFEILPAFAIAIIIAQLLPNARQDIIDYLAIIFIITRIIYILFYLTNRSRLRSITWFTNILIIVLLFTYQYII